MASSVEDALLSSITRETIPPKRERRIERGEEAECTRGLVKIGRIGVILWGKGGGGG